MVKCPVNETGHLRLTAFNSDGQRFDRRCEHALPGELPLSTITSIIRIRHEAAATRAGPWMQRFASGPILNTDVGLTGFFFALSGSRTRIVGRWQGQKSS